MENMNTPGINPGQSSNQEDVVEELSQGDREDRVNKLRGLYDYASKKSQEDAVMDNIKDMIRDMAESIDKLNKKVFAGEQEAQAAQDPLNGPVGVSNPQQQPNPQADFMNQLMAATAAGGQGQQQATANTK